ncbi:MAG: CBS domain-containing protein [Chitinophagaceae bacterium]|nr:MAG: CBS domain-containing protein [Chitinophagaceae bacterium]
MRTVAQLLATKSPVFNVIEPGALVINALSLMNSLNLSYIVVKDDETYRGIFSERDYARNVILKGKSSSSITVSEAMTIDLPIVETSDTVENCMQLMITHKTRYLLAYDGEERFAGVVTIHDLLREVINNRELVFDKSITTALLNQDEEGIL